MGWNDRADKGALAMSDPVYVVGVDISGAHLDIHVFGQQKGRTLTNDASGIGLLLRDLKPRKARGETVLVVMEATGGLEWPLRQALNKADIPCHVANPKRIRAYAKAIGWLAKTDQIDAALLARFGAHERPTHTRPLDETRQQVRALLTYRTQILDEITARRAQLKLFHDGLKSRAEQAIDRLKADLAEIDTDIHAFAGKPELEAIVKRLTTCPSVGILTAITLAAHMPELGELDAGQVASLAGLAPIAKDSGNVRGLRTIQGGRPNVRKALYMATLVATRFNPDIKAFYQRLIKAGKKPKVALTACMRKLITILNAMLKTAKNWMSQDNMELEKKTAHNAGASKKTAPHAQTCTP